MPFDREIFAQKYDVHPETIAYLDARAAEGARPYTELGVVEARKASEAGTQKYAGYVTFDGTELELMVPSSTSGDIPVTVYKPKSCDKFSSPTILVYFHGGGNCLGSRKSHETVCKILASDSACIVVTVEYRLAPEHKFPANNDDARDVVSWVAAHKVDVGGDKSSRLGVSGDSAGGRLAAVVCHEQRDSIDFAVLIYPNVSMRFEHPSVQEFKDGPLLSWEIISWFRDHFGINDETMNHPRASVLRSQDFMKLPPTLFIVAELDPLRDGCYEYYDILKKAGTTVDMVTIRGVPHAFWHMPVAFKDKCKEAYAAATSFIKKFG